MIAVPADVSHETKKPRPPHSPTVGLVRIEDIDVGANIRMDPGELEGLAASIREVGILQPLKVVPIHDGKGQEGKRRFVLIWGQRRLLAAKLAGLELVPVVYEPFGASAKPGPRRSIEQLVENLQRADLNPIDEAKALREVLAADETLTQEALADKLGRSRPWVTNTLRLLGVDETVQARVLAGEISATHARAIATLPPDKQQRLAERAVRDKLSAHEIERQTVKWHQDEMAAAEAKRKRTVRLTPKVIAALEKAEAPKTASLHLSGSWEIDVPAIVTAVKAAGWKKVDQRYLFGGRSVGCDCTDLRVEINGRGAGVIPSCNNEEHRGKEDKRQRALDEAARMKRHELLGRLGGAIAESLTTTTPDTAVLRVVAFVMLRTGGSWADWKVYAEKTEGELIQELATRLSQEYLVRDVDVAAVIEELGFAEPTEASAS